MRGTMLIFRPHERRPMAMRFDRAPTLEELQGAINGGYLELIGGFNTIGYGGTVMDCVAFCDEHGKINNLELNQVATAMWVEAWRRRGQAPPPDYLVGPVTVIFGDREFMEAL